MNHKKKEGEGGVDTKIITQKGKRVHLNILEIRDKKWGEKIL